MNATPETSLPAEPSEVVYLRSGRKVRARGKVIERDTRRGLTRVLPDHGRWKSVWLTTVEIEAGSVKPPMAPRNAASATPARQKRPAACKHHPALVAAWKSFHDGIAADIIPEPGPTFVAAWNLGYEQARIDAGIFAPPPAVKRKRKAIGNTSTITKRP